MFDGQVKIGPSPLFIPYLDFTYLLNIFKMINMPWSWQQDAGSIHTFRSDGSLSPSYAGQWVKLRLPTLCHN